MLREVLTIGDKIDIKPLDRNGRVPHNARTYVSQLVDFTNSDEIHVAAPIVYSKAIILENGSYNNLCFYTSKGLYQCNCIVQSSHRDNNTIIMVVRITTNLEKYQRRQYFRLECIHDIEYRVITKEEEILENKLKMNDFRDEDELTDCTKRLSQLQKQWAKAVITDISGGGARFTSKIQLNQGDKLLIKLNIMISNENKNMLLNANIIASNKNLNKSDAYENRVEFTDITQKEREDLIKYVFEQERKRRKNDKN